MQIDFLIHSYTELRYLLPIAERIGDSHTKRAFVNRRTSKYNTVATLGEQMMFNMLQDRGVEMLPDEHPSGGDVIFSVEGVTPYAEMRGNYSRIVSLQHGFDYFNPKSHLDQRAISVLWDQASASQISEMKPGIVTYVPRKPTTFWNSRSDLEFARQVGIPKKSALIYYPDQGFTKEAALVIDAIVRAGISPIIKQRAKHQQIQRYPGASEVYDRIWYPSESIFLSVSTLFSVGFGTAAYTDVCATGIDFIDFALPDYSRLYAKPVGVPQFHVGSLSEIDAQISFVAESSRHRSTENVDDSSVQDFFLKTVGEDLG